MAWKNGYYYRNKRVGASVVSEYVGSGILAVLAAERDAQRRAEADADRERWRAFVAEQRAIDAQLDAIDEQVHALTTAALLVAGFHQHRRQWRKRRG